MINKKGELETRKIIFVDGHCNLCNHLVKTLLWIDSHKTLYFSSLLSDFSVSFFASKHTEIVSKTSVVFYDGSNLFFKSEAILKIADSLGFPYSLLKATYIIPSFVRDSIYDFIAKNRYKIFGQNSICHITGKKENTRFIDSY
jgi:predicted DCC family thiol-disulfide oxidoreductase YuxK